MFRYKILLNKSFRCKPKTVINVLTVGFSTNFLPSVRQSIFLINLEKTNFWEAFLFNGKFPNIRNNKKYMSQISQITCWNCKENLKLKNFTCSLCGALQPPKPNLSFFELLGVSQTFDIDLEDLTKNFRNLQKIFHPDKAANKPEKELAISETYSRLLNKAFTTLKDPVSRGYYLLEFNKVSLETNYVLDPKFLSVIMEKNEELETIDSLSSLGRLLEANNEEIEKQYSVIQNAFHNNKLVDAHINLLKLNYLFNLNKKIKEKEMKLNSSKDGKTCLLLAYHAYFKDQDPSNRNKPNSSLL